MGALRIGLFPSFMYTRVVTGGSGSPELEGIAVALGRALAARRGDKLESIEYAAPPQVVAGLKAGGCDAAFLGIDPVRARDVEFGPPLMRADLTFIVPAGSAAISMADIDQPGVRVAVVRNHTMETQLLGKLAAASMVYAATPDAAIELLRAGAADVAAGIRPGLMAYAARLPGARVLADRYGSNAIALAVLKGRPAPLAEITAFSAAAKASGLAHSALAAAGLLGVEVPA